jgi:hypothetical protein
MADDADALASIARSLDLLSKVAVLQLLDDKEQNDRVTTLDGLGFKPTQIAAMLGMKPNTVAVKLRRLKARAEAAE